MFNILMQEQFIPTNDPLPPPPVESMADDGSSQG